MPEDSDKKKRLWEVDPYMFEKGPKPGFVERRILPTLKNLGKYGLIGLALTYPLYLVYIGLVYGGLAFWSFLFGSSAVIGVILWKLGFAAHYASWGTSYKSMIGVIGAGFVAIGFYIGLFYLKTWLLPIAFALSAVGFFFVLRRKI